MLCPTCMSVLRQGCCQEDATPVCPSRTRSVWILAVTGGNDFREVAPASVYLGEMTLDVTLIMYAAVDAGFADETYNMETYRPQNMS